ncbi:MAG TPA: thymidine phosphorylase [Verrucomicrobiota bacterium]|nr:thymidine phosphorylase [Verrucomicrobiota bacterium]HRT10097.1 thymidine phosphorylase [Candidatus Paceibacterota bacterium]
MSFLALIEAKRDGRALSPAQIGAIVSDYTAGHIPDYQMAAFLMAVFFRGLNSEETAALTLAMRDSGETLSWPTNDPRPVVDKHSTGGVGDKVSLPLAPLLACLGFRVPMISGRGLGITGGTLDKLDSIPGFRTLLPTERIQTVVQQVGCVMCGQTDRMVPADKGLYALRDVIGTVPSIPLIVASILSKKLAEQLQALILDVKFGAAAFMPTLEQARELALAMVRLGSSCGVNTRALLTAMDHPLGGAVGNWLEVKESVRCLEGTGPAPVRELVIECAAHLLVQTGKCGSLAAAREQATACLESGNPRRKWNEMLAAQGADLEAFERKLALDVTAPAVVEIHAPVTGFVSRCDARQIGEVVRDLGGGRLTKDSVINYEVGVDQLAGVGTAVAAGALIARVHAADDTQARRAALRVQSAIEITPSPPAPSPLIRESLVADQPARETP